MRIPHSSTLQRDFGVSMTPMIDVVFLLLIFFVCTASFQLPESILPSALSLSDGATSPEEIELERIVIAVGQREDANTILVNDQPCASLTRLSELLAALVKIDATLPVVLDIASATPLGTAIDVYDRCRLAGFRRIQFATDSQP